MKQRFLFLYLVVLLISRLVSTQGVAQEQVAPTPLEFPHDLVVNNRPVIVRTEAIGGEPFGIGRVSFRMRGGDEMIDRTGSIMIEERQNRILYPVVTRSAFRKFIQTFANIGEGHPDDVHHVWFLFRGDQPLDVQIQGTGTAAVEIPVEFAKSRQYARFARQWWQAFSKATNDQIEAGDYPPIVETYLTSMIGKRLGLEVPKRLAGRPDPLMQTFELLFNVESIRLETIQNTIMHGLDLSPANLPVPAPIRWTPLTVTDLPQQIEIEPLAFSVPEECFYLRFGTWQNQLWLQNLLEEFGGDLGRMIQLRGFKYKIQSKFLDQLAIESSELDQLFGGKLIDDVAVIGMDTYFDDGSAVGVLLHAKDSDQLKNSLQKKRNKFVQAHLKQGATLEAVQIGKHTIELLSTPDNRYRSFYAVSGDSHLTTNSRRIAERFLESCEGQRSLGASDEFRFARYHMPLSRDDTVFIYLSARFFQQLLSPEYQIELRRRNRIITDIMLLEMAKLAAASEGNPDADIPDLVRFGFLPTGFGHRPDQGNFRSDGEKWVDSIRGRRGFFIPIPDLKIDHVTAEEANWFHGRAKLFSDSIRSLDPMLVALKRYEFKNNVERVVYDARVAPFGEEKYGWLISMLGPPLKHEIAPMPEDIIRLQASMRGGMDNPNVPAHQIFAGVQDHLDPDVDLRPTSFLRLMDTFRDTPGYIGAWPSPGYLDKLPALGAEPDPLGYTYSRLLKLWRLQWEGFSILSFDQDRLERLKPHLKVVESARPAQIRLTVGDLANSKLNTWANAVNYRRSWQTSIANVRFLNLLTQQFRVPPELARITAERMLDVELVCSLGGKYRLAELPSGRKIWHSDAWPSFTQPVLPENHTAPLLKWFRGLELEISKTETQFTVHGFLDIQRSESDSPLPSFDLFKGFGLFSGSDKD